MKAVDYERVAVACKVASVNCTEIPIGEAHGASWLYNQCMRAFEDADIFTLDVRINLVGYGKLTINRQGDLMLQAGYSGAKILKDDNK